MPISDAELEQLERLAAEATLHWSRGFGPSPQYIECVRPERIGRLVAEVRRLRAAVDADVRARTLSERECIFSISHLDDPESGCIWRTSDGNLVVEGSAKPNGMIEVDDPLFTRYVTAHVLIQQVIGKRVRVTVEILDTD